ncbi:MAG: hypothetical protein FJX57_07880 [Alphaproteobacteria bacterium]|nr:hypothetical protein [Alphaproteobacteria bacterium]
MFAVWFAIARRWRVFTAVALMLQLAACGGTLYATVPNTAGNPVMLLGHDPVAYFTLGKPTKGNKALQVRLADPDRTYYFVNEEHRRMFQANPARYEPQYGGFCSNGAPYGIKMGSDPSEFEIVNGRLFIFGDILGHEYWKMHRDENIANADRYWPQFKDRGWRETSIHHILNEVPWYRRSRDLRAEYARRNDGKTLSFDPGGPVRNLLLKYPGWRAAEGFGQPALGYPE